MYLRDATVLVRGGGELGFDGARTIFGELLDAPFDAAELSELLCALADRGEDAQEVAGAARALRDRMVRFEHDHPNAIDTCGTGGDGLSTFNLSTAAAIVAAAAGAKVIKHGNRAQSSRCGSADLLEALGIPLDLPAESARRVLDDVGITFLLAPAYHPLVARVAPVRRALARRTMFNWLGPLCNPGDVRAQVLGVSTDAGVEAVGEALNFMETVDESIAEAEADIPTRRAYVVHGAGGADELTLAGENRVLAINVEQQCFDAAAFGLSMAPVSALRGGDSSDNARLCAAIFAAERSPLYDAVRLNAAAALAVAYGEPADVALARATDALDSKAAARTLDRWRSLARAERANHPS